MNRNDSASGSTSERAASRRERKILVVAHAHRDDTVDAAVRVVGLLRSAGAVPVLAPDDRAELSALAPSLADVAALGEEAHAAGADAVVAHPLDFERGDEHFDGARRGAGRGHVDVPHFELLAA